MRFFFAAVAFTILSSLSAQETNIAPRAIAVNPAEMTNTAPDQPPQPGHGVTVHWYGHGFIYLISSVGVRVAIDPFGPNLVSYKFPIRLPADFVLISHEAEDHASTEQLFGTKLIFPSVTAVGLNRANGIPFHGTALSIPKGQEGVSNTAFQLKFDGISFAYLGRIRGPLLGREAEDIGHVDVVFLPVGLPDVSIRDLNEAALALNARVIIPVEYKTPYSGDLPLRTVDDYLAGTQFPVRSLPSEEVVLSPETLPSQTTVYKLALPTTK